jgi:hypothetical protein
MSEQLITNPDTIPEEMPEVVVPEKVKEQELEEVVQ